jgi:hypothetical protein
MRALLLLILAVLAAVLSPAPVVAQESPLELLLKDFNRRQQRLDFEPRIIDMQQPKKTKRAKTRLVGPALNEFRGPPYQLTPPEPPGPSQFVTVFGDSMAALLADGLTVRLTERPDIAIAAQTRSSSGFVRDDFYDWNKAITDYLAATPKIDAVVIHIGTNDRQQLRDDAGTYEVRDERWRAIYAKRIDAALALLAARNIRIFWVGLPSMKSEKLNADVVYFNEIYRERVEKAGGTYIDIWDAFVDENGKYAGSGPDLNGQAAKLRAGDGVHFTKAGAQLAAHYVERDLIRLFGDAPVPLRPTLPSITPLAAAPALPRSAVSGVSVSTLNFAPIGDLVVPVPATEPPPRPVAGPILPLDPVERSTGAALLGEATAVSVAGPATAGGADKPVLDPLATRLLVRGDALVPMPGRIDDFSWPRPTDTLQPAVSSRVDPDQNPVR